MKAPVFELRGKSIQCRATNGVKNVVRLSTGLSVGVSRWDVKKQATVGITAEEKKTNSTLRKITDLVEADATITKLTSEWLKDIINEASGKANIKDRLLFLNICSMYIDSKSELARNTLSAYNRAFDLLTEFIDNNKVYVIEVDTTFMHDFKRWLRSVKFISNNSAIQHTRFINTVLNYCVEVKGFDVSKMRSYKESGKAKKRGEIVMLYPAEIKSIKDLKDLPEHLENSRIWLLIGIEIGQRAGDLLSITSSNIKGNRLYLTQQKTGKDVIVPLTQDTIDLIHSIAYQIDVTSLNRNIKKLCEIAEINAPVLYKQNIKGVETLVSVPKHIAIGTHAMRRTYATSKYGKISNALIMSVTGHSTEAMLIKYIGLSDEEIATLYEEARDKLKL